jgi:hypothetical protein
MRVLIAGLATVALHWIGFSATAQSPVDSTSMLATPRTTIVIFSDRKMEDLEWTALFDALRRNLVEAAAESQSIEVTPELVRGDAIDPGLRVDSAIVVFLHGNCNLQPLMRRTVFGVPLGWVREMHGRIEPFAHVDCTRIGQVLGVQALGVNQDRRTAIMAGAIARVILHEWIHIATQCSAHSEQGIEKAQFGVADLMGGDSQPMAWRR